jgi:hypothetical protein
VINWKFIKILQGLMKVNHIFVLSVKSVLISGKKLRFWDDVQPDLQQKC